MLTEAHVYMRCHQGAKDEHFDISNVIYHKFSHGAAFYTLNWKNFNVMLKCSIMLRSLSFRFIFFITVKILNIGTCMSEQTV